MLYRHYICFLILSVFAFPNALKAFQSDSLCVNGLFKHHMVLQREKSIPIWGTGKPETTVHVSLNNQRASATVQPDSTWCVQLSAMPAGGPHILQITDLRDSIFIDDVYVGEVWLASGQSNMEFTLGSSLSWAEEQLHADFPNIRFFQVVHGMNNQQQHDVQGSWVRSSAATAAAFSGVAYHFAKKLHQEKNIAVGIIQSAWGGTPIEPWISEDALSSREETKPSVIQARESGAQPTQLYAKYLQDVDAFENASEGLRLGVHTLAYQDQHWKKVSFPLQVSSIYGDETAVYIPGCYLWVRKHFDLSSLDKDATLQFDELEGKATIYLNGTEIELKNAQGTSQGLVLPKSVLKKGRNLLAIRLRSLWATGAVGHSEGSVSLLLGTKHIKLDGEWLSNISVEPRYPDLPKERNNPGVLFNAMIAPLIPYSVQGVLWYQGEANTWRPRDYQFLFPLLIQDWRIRWQQGYMPFLFVQLPNFGGNNLAPADESWAYLREAQLMTLPQPATGMAVSIDIGDATDIHPRNKKDVGLRLYEAARHIAYHEDNVYSGPLYRRMEIKDHKIIVYFDHARDGLISKTASVEGFQIAGADNNFEDATATIVGNTVELTHPSLKNPTTIRYGWAADPKVSLYNTAGLPASPFRTDK
ncbi:sialate O-acetylesterase [Sphingobacterium olei]|uniref:Sialate O-acetylesterase n=2 Tax=Sphingobacterium olei TaxID=2571155 RepID=A0A4U0P0J9_9SPHI|nr:sialate O-acetylesterase [Sphingobacterium olei]